MKSDFEKQALEIKMIRNDLSVEFIIREIQKQASKSICDDQFWINETMKCAREGSSLPWEPGYLITPTHNLFQAAKSTNEALANLTDKLTDVVNNDLELSLDHCDFCGQSSNRLTQDKENLLCPRCIESAHILASLGSSGFDFHKFKVPTIEVKTPMPSVKPPKEKQTTYCGASGANVCSMCPDYDSCLANEKCHHREKKGSKETAVEHPTHYTSHPSGVEVITITEHMNFCLGNAIKYILRCDLKGNPIEDLKKAKWYIEREIQRRLQNDNS